MKALSIKEPWASLIINGYKEYEFRSFKTNYRGKILIHASLKKSPAILEFQFLNLNYQPGFIIGEATLTDCLKLTPELREELFKKNNLVYNKISNKAQYAWYLTDIKKYSKPIPATGALSLWNYYSLEEIETLMNNISYGWVSKNKEIRGNTNTNFFNDFLFQTPKELIKSKIGICWEQVELERYYLQHNNWDLKTYFIVYNSHECPTHTFLTFKKANLYYWFEHSWEEYAGIHTYDTLEKLLTDVKNKFVKSMLKNKCNISKLALYEYSKPKKHINVTDFFTHCEQGINLIPYIEEVK